MLKLAPLELEENRVCRNCSHSSQSGKFVRIEKGNILSLFSLESSIRGDGDLYFTLDRVLSSHLFYPFLG